MSGANVRLQPRRRHDFAVAQHVHELTSRLDRWTGSASITDTRIVELLDHLSNRIPRNPIVDDQLEILERLHQRAVNRVARRQRLTGDDDH